MSHKKESAGGVDTTTADTNQTFIIIPLHRRIMTHLVRVATVLATVFRGLA